MKIAVAQLNYEVGNIQQNTAKITDGIAKAKAEGADLVVFSEMAVSGCPLGDLLLLNQFVEDCHQAIKEIAAACEDIACIVGAPFIDKSAGGKRRFNSAFLLKDGVVASRVDKKNVSDYFGGSKYFEPATVGPQVIEFQDQGILLTIGEDLYDADLAVAEAPSLGSNPALMINIAARSFDHNTMQTRVEEMKGWCITRGLPLIFVNQVGAQTEYIFPGGSLALGKKGDNAMQLDRFSEDMTFIDLSGGDFSETGTNPQPSKIELIHDALVLGIKDYFNKSGFKKAILGLSGGIDSAVVCALAAEALGAGNVMAVLMPSQYSTDHSVNDAMGLVRNLGCLHETIAIKEVADAYEHMLSGVFKGLPFDVTEENVQARCRATLLMAMSNKFGYILLNTSNKSECAVGYGTLYGDMAGALAVLGDVYKTEVYELARFINRDGEIIPVNSIVKPPSAELRPGQKDSDSLPEYDILDKVLFEVMENFRDPSELKSQGFDEELVDKIMAMLRRAEFKRYQSPPILKVSSRAFGTGWHMPVVSKYL